jgi:hypothetical protein
MPRVFYVLLTIWTIAAVSLIALGVWHRDEQVIDGKTVQRRVIWQGRGMGNPIPTGRLSQVYYFYRDEHGKDVKHGEFRTYHLNGVMSMLANYRHGRPHGKSSLWDESGQLRKF